MGRLDSDPFLNHFSHPHALKPLNFQTPLTSTATCAGCKLQACGWMYACSSCNFYLHKACSQMPQQKTHQFDPNHALTLHPLAVYGQGVFKCNACGKRGTGFCYHCDKCKVDLHTLCAHMPSSVNVNTHHHALNLHFYTPYRKKGFRCDICNGSGSNHWLYRCETCNFDAHLNCAVVSVQSKPASEQQEKQQQLQLVKSRSTPLQTPTSPSTNTVPIPTIHHFSQAPNLTSGQYAWNSSIHMGDQIPAAESSSRRSFPSEHQTDGYAPTMPVLVVPQVLQPPRANSLEGNLAGILAKGVVDGMAEQAGQILLQSILGGFLN